MTLTALLVTLIIGAIAGWLAGLIVKGHGQGLLMNIVVGIIGAVIAGWLFPMMGLGLAASAPIVGTIIFATIGAVILLLVVRLVQRA
ncbi:MULTISPECIES: GlsB/YeaQ/YmgE family stress response membrane protein [unclassified Paracoccus (in: a-proteobacteria)]|uniref:GlsB/YeaQ/YmgE family stress response membrane protein n=1 Tax=unclassified Paracoccus (in: a-proteobacteria) TaxID=2688777 RepID=UPI0012B223EC|nr:MULTISPECIES: GlsB/YeaQ/YmgE family stress response membrane protein [unclassified Paracoccus (in: a-proteobacteria)]UXU76114.1 GlsB/YeaQ/YmgE family stress response membrane protein [Paracoccus sp. SMMA_5]UXU82026.1 GlsB/YeaQ/YmgE family stress response membrane protein [Paracoccus sp. SMMA_5_TC]